MPKVFTLRAIEYAVEPGKQGTDERGRAFIKSQAVHATIKAGTVVDLDEGLLKSLPSDAVREPTAPEIAVAAVENGGVIAKHRAGNDQTGDEGGEGDEGDEGDEGGEGGEAEQSARRERRRRRV